LQFFAPQERHVSPIVTKFGTAEENNNPLRPANVCHAGCAKKRSGRSTTYNVTVCRANSMRFPVFFTERNDSTISLGGATMFDGIGETFEKFSKTDGKVCEYDIDHLGAAHNKSSTRPFYLWN